jgi:acetyl esterase
MRLTRARRRAGSLVIDSLFRGISAAGRLHPLAQPARHNVEVLRNLAYLPTGMREHRLDVYRPIGDGPPRPVVLYVHGGGFRILSKDTHWLMALAFARRGYVVFNINYRLSPRYPFPAGLADACQAYGWVAGNAARFGGDPARLALAGESAGANLVTALTVASSFARPEPWTRPVWEAGVRPRAVLPACGILQVSDPERFTRRRKLPAYIADRILEVSEAYLEEAAPPLDLADPLLVLERAEPPARPLPPFFAPVGTADPMLDDTRRLARALERLGVECDARYYPGEAHAFHALVFRAAERKCWQDMFTFLKRTL